MSVKQTPSIDQPTLTFDRPVLIFVEGPDDRAFVSRQALQISDGTEWHVHFVTGKGADWVDLIGFALDDSQFAATGRAIGVVIDADLNASGAVDKARSIFERAGLPVPSGHSTVARGPISTGFYVMPDGLAPGAIEEILLQSVDPERLEVAAEYIRTVSERFPAPKNMQKAVLQAFLAGQREHLKTVPVAVQKKDVFPPEHAVFSEFRTFLQALAAT